MSFIEWCIVAGLFYVNWLRTNNLESRMRFDYVTNGWFVKKKKLNKQRKGKNKDKDKVILTNIPS